MESEKDLAALKEFSQFVYAFEGVGGMDRFRCRFVKCAREGDLRTVRLVMEITSKKVLSNFTLFAAARAAEDNKHHKLALYILNRLHGDIDEFLKDKLIHSSFELYDNTDHTNPMKFEGLANLVFHTNHQHVLFEYDYICSSNVERNQKIHSIIEKYRKQRLNHVKRAKVI